MNVAVVIPSYKVKAHIHDVIRGIPSWVQTIIIVDDACPQKTGADVKANCTDPRVKVVFHSVNAGVGAAVVTGYKTALDLGAEIAVKMDGDNQMDPTFLPQLIKPIEQGYADYTKGNRFHRASFLQKMPFIRLIGNAVLSFIAKACSGYWNIMDPTNGYTAIHADTLRKLRLDELEKRYFFENDILYHLYLERAVTEDVPMPSIYKEEISNLKIHRILLSFPKKYLTRFLKRILYTYFIRDFNMASLQLVFGSCLFIFGLIFGLYHWYISSTTQHLASTGTVMIAVLPIILGFQLLLSFIAFDVTGIPKRPNQTCERRT